jgi:hypothetical protein
VRAGVVREHRVVGVVAVRVAGEVPELVDEHGAELGPIPVLERVEDHGALGVVVRVAVVGVLIEPARDGVLVGRQRAPGDRDIAMARIEAPVGVGDLPGLIRPGLGSRLRGGGRRRDDERQAREQRADQRLREAFHGDTSRRPCRSVWGSHR